MEESADKSGLFAYLGSSVALAFILLGLQRTNERRVTWPSTPSGPCSHRPLCGDPRDKNMRGRGAIGSSCERYQGIVAGSNRLRNDGRHFVRVDALFAARIYRRGHVEVGRAALYARIRVIESRNQQGVDLCIRTSAHRAAIDVIPRYSRGTRIPGQRHRMLYRRNARSRQRDRSG
jgi:hypothetical protein